MGNRILIAVGAATVAALIWYFFLYEPADPFETGASGDVLADPKDPPDPNDREIVDLQGGEEMIPVKEEKDAKPTCPPGDPMCGGL